MTGTEKRLFQSEKMILVLLLVLLIERLLLFYQFGPEYMSHSDDDAYLASGNQKRYGASVRCVKDY